MGTSTRFMMTRRGLAWAVVALVATLVACSSSTDSELAALDDVILLSDVPSVPDDAVEAPELTKPEADVLADLAMDAELGAENSADDASEAAPEMEPLDEIQGEVPSPLDVVAEAETSPELSPEIQSEPLVETTPELDPEPALEPGPEIIEEVTADATEELYEETSETDTDTGTDTSPEVSTCFDDPSICEDNNPCTQTWCGQGGHCASVCNCAWTCATDSDCAMDNQCIVTTCEVVGDATCGGSECVWELLACEEPEDPCWTAECDPQVGCVNVMDDWAPCDDGDPYTTNDHCLAGACFGSCEPLCVDEAGEALDCGLDGCGGSCGTCPQDYACEEGSCEPSCPPYCGAVPNCTGPVAFNGHGYYLCTQAKNYAQALQSCANHGTHLVTISSEAENDFIAGFADDEWTIWIGLDDRTDEGSFVWVTGEPLSYQDWSLGQPSDGLPPLGLGSEDCAKLNPSNGKWGDDACDDKAAFVCEVE
jgi:Lectin C-type domain